MKKTNLEFNIIESSNGNYSCQKILLVNSVRRVDLREWVDIDAKNIVIVSRIIKATIEGGVIKFLIQLDKNVVLKSKGMYCTEHKIYLIE